LRFGCNVKPAIFAIPNTCPQQILQIMLADKLTYRNAAIGGIGQRQQDWRPTSPAPMPFGP
jgi:hypothetical protein